MLPRSSYRELVIVICLDLGKGKDRALLSGMKNARGGIIVHMDGDLQNDPVYIPSMLGYLSEADMVCGIRSRRDVPMLKKAVSKLANHVINLITGDTVEDAGCALKVMRISCADRIFVHASGIVDSVHYFFSTIAKICGIRVEQVPVNHRPRTNGTSKFALFHGRVLSGIRACLMVRALRRNIRGSSL